jgi:hypothetical protein
VRKLADIVVPLIVAVVLSAVSCQRGSVSGTVPVSGKVTYKGQPVAQATVTFIGEGEARAAVAITDASGIYQLKTLDSAGAMPGKYTVLVSQTEAMPGSDRPVSMDEAAKNQGKPKEPKQLLPAKYMDPTKSPLKFQVDSGKANTFDLSLTD